MNLREQEEIQRIKLLMGYNIKKTLSENYSKVLNEQTPSSVSAKLGPPKASGLGKKLPPPGQQGASNQLWYLTLFLNANPDEIGTGKKYNYLWLDFLNKVKGGNLNALLDTRNGALTYDVTIDGKKYSPYDLGIGGGITKDLPDFEGKAGNTGVATAVLDGQIYGLRLKDYLKKSKDWENTPWKKNPATGQNFKIDSKGQLFPEPKQPNEPQWGLLKTANINTGGLTAQNTASALTSVGSYGKGASEILGGDNEKKNVECYFKNNEEGNKFRRFVNNVYPELAATLELSKESSKAMGYCNSYINKAYDYYIANDKRKNGPNADTLGKAYIEFTKQSAENDLSITHNPDSMSFVSRTNCEPFCSFDKEEVKIIEKCITKDSWNKNVEFLTSSDEKFEIVSLSLGACASNGTISSANAEYLTKKFKNLFYGTFKNITSPVNTTSQELEAKKQQEVLKQDGKKASEQEKAELSQLFDFSKFPTKNGEAVAKKETTEHPCTPWYWGTSPMFEGVGLVTEWVEPNTQIKVTIHCKTEAQVLDELIVLYKKQQKDDYTKKLIESPKMWEIFGYEKLMKASKECQYKLDDFLLGVESGAIYDKETGLAYGAYTISPKDGRTPVIVKWPANEPIPCESEFWDKYGEIIKWGGMLVSLAIPFVGGAVPLLAAISTRIFVSAAIDFGVNLTSAYFNEKAGRHEEAKMDVAIALISVAIDTIPGLSKKLAFGMDDWSEDFIVKTFRDKIKDGTIKSYDDLLKYTKTLKETEQKVVRNVLDNPQLGEALKTLNGGNSTLKRITKAVDGRIAQITKQSKLGLFGETLLKNLGIKIPLVISPMIPVYGPKLIAAFTGTYKAVYGKDPNKEILDEFIENYPKYFADLDYDEMADELTNNPKSIQKVLDNEDYQKNYVDKQVKNAKVIVDGKEEDFTSEMQKQADILRKIDEEQKAHKQEQQNETPKEIEDEKMVEEFEEETKVDLEKYEEGQTEERRPKE
jgi:hypothetical protein